MGAVRSELFKTSLEFSVGLQFLLVHYVIEGRRVVCGVTEFLPRLRLSRTDSYISRSWLTFKNSRNAFFFVRAALDAKKYLFYAAKAYLPRRVKMSI